MPPAVGQLARPFRSRKFVLWMVLAAVLFAGFVWLGIWQVQRYHLKLGISHALQTRVHAAPVAAPGPAEWPHANQLQYLHVSLHGHYLPDAQTLVRGSSRDGYGLWVMMPFATARGFIVLVNRGYIPDSLPKQPAFASIQPPSGTVTITGLLRASEPGGGFLRRNQPQQHLWYSRDVAAIAATQHLPAGKVAPYFVDADAAADAKGWPVAGLTKVSVYNHSLGYAITWFLLALGTLLCAGIVIRHERRP
jgi:surfeit locus 1 family protein